MQDPRALKAVGKSHPSLLAEGGFEFKLQILELRICNCLETKFFFNFSPDSERGLSQLQQGSADA